ncbi:beta-1,3-glucan-binding protein 2-like [Coccinella septempunctata]|uniref:beta-1,3-glucan-binding protein 2-like n=1 Tax=Coccinella septempunctata TaxID=41139 RepID=UPI001D06EC32|nr:beta-1,3-glucan-binding protein 2-like [Coccinella septempunctata]
MLTLVILIFSTLNVVLSSCDDDYYVPEPKFELLFPKGFSVKIPHSEGISIFAFHGKINEEMGFLEAGTFSKDTCRRSGDYWIFEDRQTNLRVGDKIYYWLFVVKHSKGYRYDNGEFTVRDDTPYRIDGIHSGPTVGSSAATDNEDTTKANEISTTATEPINTSRQCKSAILNITDALLKLRSEVNSLKDTNEILREISEKHPESARTLKVEGRIPYNEDALGTVKGIIEQKLLLSIEIAKARRNNDRSITFQTSSVDDKVQIIKAAKEKLRYSKIYITY